MIGVHFDRRAWKDFQALLEEGDARFQAVAALVAARTAQHLLAEVQGRVQRMGAQARYGKALSLVKVEGLPTGQTAFAVIVRPSAQGVRELDPKKTVLYVRPKKRRLAPTDPAVAVLARHNPWTVETIPYWPEPGLAILWSRKVRAEEADWIAEKRQGELPEVRRELLKAGKYTTATSQQRVKVPPQTPVVPDVAFDALRMEFGFGGGKPKPVWRPAVRTLPGVVQALLKGREIGDTLNDPRSRAWVGWPPLVASGSISVAEAMRYKDFAEKVS